MNEEQYISVSSLAKILNCSTQTIYNRIKSGRFEAKTFQRGKMRGLLVKYKV